MSLIFLWIIPLPFLSAAYQPGHLVTYGLAGGLQACLICAAGLALTRREKTPENGKTVVLIAAGLLLFSWAVVSLALNMGPPPEGQQWLSTLPDQNVRYMALVLGSLICFGGFTILAAQLCHEGRIVFASLGFASIVISTVLFVLHFLIFSALLNARFVQELASGISPGWWETVTSALSFVRHVFRNGAHLGSIFFLVELWRSGRVSRTAGITVAAVITLLTIVGGNLIQLPPAVLFLPPYLMGVSILALFGASANKTTAEVSA